MITKNIYILSAPKHSGKTTRLIEWSVDRDDVFGILTPIVNGKRVFMDAHSKEQFQMEAGENEINILEVGKYRFSRGAFKRASTIISNSIIMNAGWVVIDEIGPLELKGEGFADAVKKVLHQQYSLANILLVIREGLVENVLHFFNISNQRILEWR